MKLGISCGCWYPSLTEDSVEKIKNAGYSAAEIFLCDETECEPKFLTELREKLDSFGIEVVAVHPYTSFAEQFIFFSEYDRRRESAYKYYRRYHKACHILGAKFINFHGATLPIKAERYAEIYRRLYLEAKAEGLDFCQENVRNFTCGKASFLAELKHLLQDEIAFTLDVKQAHMEGEDLSEMIRIMGKDIKLVHISDHSDNEPCMLPGFGTFDTEGFIKKLRDIGYDGYLITEIYSRNYKKESEIKDSRLFLSDILNKI